MFTKRFHLFSVAGFKIGIDLSWFLIAILLSWTLAAGYFPVQYPKLSSGEYWLMGISGMLGLFICVLLHELGHAFVAKHFKIPTKQITLFIFGGVAEIEKEPTTPKIEFLVAIAGPIVSFVLAFVLYVISQASLPLIAKGVLTYLALINFILALFNLLPAFPLDGGRIFRSILWGIKGNLSWATNVATRTGSFFGYFLLFWGIFSFIKGNFLGGFWLMIIGWFLNRAAQSMRSQYYVGRELEGESVVKFMTKDPITVPPTISIKQCVEEYLYQSHHHLYPVTEHKKLLGYISLKEIKSVPHDQWSRTLVQTVMVPVASFKTVTPETSALEAMNVFQNGEGTTLLVEKEGHLLGILTSQDLLKVIAIKIELEEASK